MGTLVHGFAWNAEQGGRSAMQRLTLPFLASAILHLLVLSALNWSGVHAKPAEPRRLTVSLVPASLPEGRVRNVQAEREHEQSPLLTVPQSDDAWEVKAGGHPLDMNRIHDQVREYARQELATSRPVAPIEGDYYGTYTGDDSGMFSFHLDSAGRAAGTGQSDTRGIAFLIEGEVLPNGAIRMVGVRKEGDSKFQGYLHGNLDMKRRTISGSWYVPTVGVVLKGTFSGQHEMQLFTN